MAVVFLAIGLAYLLDNTFVFVGRYYWEAKMRHVKPNDAFEEIQANGRTIRRAEAIFILSNVQGHSERFLRLF